jgi:hypothetical protein
MNFDEAARRYRDDPGFHGVVEMLRGVIVNLQLSPGEVRDAAMFAAYLVELYRPSLPFPLQGEIYDALIKKHGPFAHNCTREDHDCGHPAAGPCNGVPKPGSFFFSRPPL